MSDTPVLVERVATSRGELVLRRAGDHYEVISNGTFLMDTRGGHSERLLVTAALAAHRPAPRSLLLGGLGVGFSLRQALADDRLERVVVVEVEPALLAWHRTHLAAFSAGALDDPRASVVVADVLEHLQAADSSYDVICLDVDNGPDWTVTPANAGLYDDRGTRLLAALLGDAGVLAVWSAAPVPSYEASLRRHFAWVESHEVPSGRGDPDVVVVAGKAGRLAAAGTAGVRR